MIWRSSGLMQTSMYVTVVLVLLSLLVNVTLLFLVPCRGGILALSMLVSSRWIELLVRGHTLRGVAVFLLLFRVNTLWGLLMSQLLFLVNTLDGQLVLVQEPLVLLRALSSKNLAHVGMMTDLVEGIEGVRSPLGVRRDHGRGQTAHATAGESEGIIVSSSVVTRFSSINSFGGSSRARMSYLDAVLSDLARAPAAALVARCSAPSSPAVGLCMHDDGSLVHDACSNSCSDTGRQGPTGTRRVKGGVSSPAEDVRLVSEVEAGVIFRPAGGVRG